MKSKRWIINCVVSQHFIANKNVFIKYRSLNPSINNVHSIKNINKSKIFINIEKIRLITNLKGRKKKIIFNNVFYIFKLFINLISQKKLIRVDVFMKLIFFNIEIDTRDITAYLKNNNFFIFAYEKKRKSTIISFNFKSSIIISMSKQHNIKFVIMIKFSIFNIKLALLHIIFKNDIVDKKRFNFVDKFILKFQYFDIFFDSKSVFNSNFDISRKINIKTFNLWHIRINHLSYQNVQRLIKMFKDIDLTKKIVDKDFYVLCVIKKARQASHKTHIHLEKNPLNLIHFDIYNFITFRDHYNDKYFVIFFND